MNIKWEEISKYLFLIITYQPSGTMVVQNLLECLQYKLRIAKDMKIKSEEISKYLFLINFQSSSTIVVQHRLELSV